MDRRAWIEQAYTSLGIDIDWRAEAALMVGTGLSGIVDELDIEYCFPYATIDGFPSTTVESHRGELLLGSLHGVRMVVFNGRFHLYEGHDARMVTLPVFLAHRLGARQFWVTNCSGGLNSLFAPGEVMMISDHINCLGVNPLTGPEDGLGPRFPDMSQAYCREHQQMLRMAASNMGIILREGVYVAVPGPSLETNAERRYLAAMGGDAVGMSTVLEVIAANYLGMKVIGLSAISNAATGGVDQQPDSIEAILENAEKAGKDIARIVSYCMRRQAAELSC